VLTKGLIINLILGCTKMTPLTVVLILFRCVEQINKASRGELSQEELKDRQVQ
jgi:hypothetical protein